MTQDKPPVSQPLPVLTGAVPPAPPGADAALPRPAPAPREQFNNRTVVERALDPETSAEQKAIVERVIDVLRNIYDPEIPINIFELGLIYDVQVTSDRRVHVKMTLTAPACPVAGTLPGEVERMIEAVPEVASATVELVWDPPWDRSRMSEAALLELGLL